MKKKLIFAVATGLFAVATVFNMNVLQSNNAGDVSLDAIAVMAQAQSEIPEVTVYGCSKWATMRVEGVLVTGCARWTSTTPCSNEC
jgi:hypothetical protein